MILHARFANTVDANEALATLMGDSGGAIHVVVVRAKPPGLVAEPRISESQLQEVLAAAVAGAGANQALVWLAAGTLPAGTPMVVVGAAADHRREAFAAVDAAFASLKGVVRREDLPA